MISGLDTSRTRRSKDTEGSGEEYQQILLF